MIRAWAAILLAVTAAIVSPAAPITFSKHIAPIVYRNCAPCHRPGEAGPFSLLTYQDVRKRARQIVQVTHSRFMPPSLPEPGYGDFAGERRLSDAQIATIRQWAEQGALEGDPADLPPAPTFVEGWQLGEPDLVLRLPRAFTLPAAGGDVFRNFILPVPIRETRYVRALEMRPGNKRTVHHANILVDRGQSSRKLDGQDGQPGFAGMNVKIASEIFDPDSHFLFWKPGTAAAPEPDGMSWRIDPGTDLVLNMHLQPSGKPEEIQPVVGLYFTDKPPTILPMLVQLEHDGAIDIPPGKKDFLVTDDFVLPLDADVLGVYPHAHYLGKDLRGYATLPDGTRKWLVWIKDWDQNWQAVYRYRKPVFLPKGTRISMRFTYDNSAENPRNPSHPPRRVVTGNRSVDEMGHLWLQLLPRGGSDRRGVLQEAVMRQRLTKYPDDPTAHYNLGAIWQQQGKTAEAIEEFRRVIVADPANATAHNGLGAALVARGQPDEALAEFRAALHIDPSYNSARYNEASTLAAAERFEQAIPEFREVLRASPGDTAARGALDRALQAQGGLLAAQGKLAEAAACWREALALEPDDADTATNLGSAYARLGKLPEAAEQFENALRIDPRHEIARKNLALLRRRGAK